MAASVTLSEAAPRTLRCSICDGNEIDAPPGSTSATRFFCRRCTARIARRKSVADGRAFGAGERVLL